MADREKAPSWSPFQRRILVIRQDRIGDVTLATGLPRELKKRWPGCRVTMLVRSLTAPLFDHNPHVDEVITDDYQPHTRNSSFWRMVRRLWRGRFTHALMVLAQARYAYMTFCAGIPFRFGHGIILYHVITLAVPVMARKLHKGRHEADTALDLVRAMGARTANPTPEIHLSAKETDEVASKRAQWPGFVVGLHTTSGQSAPNWSGADWGDLVRRLAEVDGVQVVVTDHEIPPEVEGVPGVAYPNLGQELRRTVCTIKAVDLLVSASTGPMHMAGALGVPTLSLFCPLPACAPAQWGPLGNEAAYVTPEEEFCRDRCPGDPHICQFAGSRQVSPEAVARRILAQRSSSS